MSINAWLEKWHKMWGLCKNIIVLVLLCCCFGGFHAHVLVFFALINKFIWLFSGV